MKITDRLKFDCFNELATVKFKPELQEQTAKKSKKKIEPEYLNVAEELTNFSEWCISEFGSWGIPVPYFVHIDSGEILEDSEISRHVADMIRQNGGSDFWFRSSIESLLPTKFKHL